MPAALVYRLRALVAQWIEHHLRNRGLGVRITPSAFSFEALPRSRSPAAQRPQLTPVKACGPGVAASLPATSKLNM
jgi:hypothetical protein